MSFWFALARRFSGHQKPQPPRKEKVRLFLLIAGFILLWYATSLAMTACNKILLDSLSFPYPLLMTFVHFAGVGLIVKSIQEFREASADPSGLERNKTALQSGTMYKFLIPIAVMSALEVGLTNQAYSRVSLSAITLIKSTLVAATYAASIIAGLERFRLSLALVLVWIIVSVGVCLPGMEVHDSFGIIILFLAVFFAAIRWVMIHRQLSDGSFNSEELIGVTQPLAALCLLPAVIYNDLPDLYDNMVWGPMDSQRTCAIVALLITAISLVVLLLICEFQVIQLTSSLTLTVAGVGKECLTIAMSTFIFQESLGPRTLTGLISSIGGISTYAYLRNRTAAPKKQLSTSELQPVERMALTDSGPPLPGGAACISSQSSPRQRISIDHDTTSAATDTGTSVDAHGWKINT